MKIEVKPITLTSEEKHMLNSPIRRLLFTLLLVLALAAVAFAVPAVLSHQGRLLDASDTPLNGVYTIVYSIYDAPVGGTQLWMEDHVGVVVTDGLFSVELGSVVPLSADIVAGSGGGGGGGGGSLRYLQVQLSGQPPIMPRTQLVSAPFSLATERVSGDFHSGPGQINVSDALSSREIRIRTTDSLLDASSITIDQPDAQITMRITPDSTVYDQGDLSGSRKMIHGIHMGENRISQVVTPTTSSVAINTKGTGADKGRSIGSTCDDSSAVIVLELDDDDDGIAEGRGIISVKSANGSGSMTASSRMSCDTDDDGIDDNDASMTVTPTTSSVAIKTKGTGADANKTATLTATATPGGNAGIRSRVDLDGDNDPEGEISQLVTPTTSNVAIKTKGTGADANKTANLMVSASPGSGVSSMSTVDLDGDNDPESEISQIVTPTTSGVAIKVKGTGAEKNRTAGSNCDDSLAVHYLDIDDDGDGISEAKAVSSVSALASGGGGAAAASYAATGRWSTDSDDDGVPEGDISQSVTPTTCGVAIKTKGTGADANRTAQLSSTTEVGEISTVSTLDEDGDGLSESSISQRIAPTTSSLAIKTKGTSAQRTQSISGDCDDESSVLSLDTDDDGDGISDAKVVLGSGASLLGGVIPGGAVISSRYDSDDDGVAEQEIDQIVTPTTCSVAIKTKGTGAEKNRVIGSTDDTTATMLMATDSASISMKVRKGGNVNGNIVINNGSALRMVEIGSGGNGYFASGVGVGVDPTHHIDVVGGAYCDGTNWVNASDKNSKENFEQVNGEEILEKISDLEITKWNYKGDDDAQHIGPTAQDFKKTFGVGADDKSISTIDPSGIALAAIKELYKQFSDEMKQKDAQIEELQKEMKKLRKELEQKKN